MKNYIWILLSIFIINFTYAQEENADAVYLKIIKEYQLNEDESTVFHYSKKLKLLTYLSFNRLYGETFIVYNPQFQELKINKSFTTMADGKIVKTPENAFNEVLPRFAANAPAYNHLREMVVTHTGLERNAVIELDYNITSSKDFFPALMGNEILSENSPINELIVIVRIPKDKSLKHKIFNLRTAPEIYNEENMKVFKWTFKNLAARSHESFQSNENEYLPRLIFSTSNNMEDVYNYLVKQAAFNYEVNKSMIKAVDEITNENEEELIQALKLQELVVNDINYYHIPERYSGFRCRTAIETWNSNGGTQLEKSILLTSLLIKADINAEPVAIIPSVYFNRELGNLLNIEEFLVRVYLKEAKQLYISATKINAQNLHYDLVSKSVLPLNSQTGLLVDTEDDSKNEIFVQGDFIYNNEKHLTGTINVKLTNALNPFLQLSKDENKAKNIFTHGISSKNINEFEIIKSAQNITIIDYKTENKELFKN